MKHYENKYYAIDIPSTHQLSVNDDSDKVQTNRKKGELWNTSGNCEKCGRNFSIKVNDSQ